MFAFEEVFSDPNENSDLIQGRNIPYGVECLSLLRSKPAAPYRTPRPESYCPLKYARPEIWVKHGPHFIEI